MVLDASICNNTKAVWLGASARGQQSSIRSNRLSGTAEKEMSGNGAVLQAGKRSKTFPTPWQMQLQQLPASPRKQRTEVHFPRSLLL